MLRLTLRMRGRVAEGSFIAPNDVMGLLAAFFAGAWLSVLAEKTKIGKQVSGVGIICFLAVAASQANVIPKTSPLYDAIWLYFVPLAIALFLIKADLVQIFTKSGRVLIAFVIGVIGAVAGAVLGALLLDLGPEEGKIVGVFSATYTGGSLNFAAVAKAVEFQDKSLLSAALAIDNVIGSAYLIPMIFLAGWSVFKKHFAWRQESILGSIQEDGTVAERPASLSDMFAGLTVAALVCAAAAYLAQAAGKPSYSILAVTALMAAVATAGRKFLARIKGEDVLAMALMYMFFAMIGAGVDLRAIAGAAPGMFVMVLMIFTVHLAFLFIAGRIMKLNYGELVIASLACITGPPVAAAVSVLFKWRSLTVPGVLTGVLGYVIGNFIGVGLFWVFS